MSPLRSAPLTNREVPLALGKAAKHHAEEASVFEALFRTHLCHRRWWPLTFVGGTGDTEACFAFQSGSSKSTMPSARFSKQHLKVSNEPCPSVSDGVWMVRCHGSDSFGVFPSMLSWLRLSPPTVIRSSSSRECRR